MIIECVNCGKKFNVDKELIPKNGRTIQCGSCNYTWFFTLPNIETRNKIETKTKQTLPKKTSPTVKEKSKSIKKQENLFDLKENNENAKFIKKNYELTKYNKKSSFTIISFLSYLIVLIISFIALVILIDTFKNPLFMLFPKLEIIFFSFFETLKDIELFIKDIF